MLIDAPGLGGVNTGPPLSRADAATFILDALVESACICKAPIVSN